MDIIFLGTGSSQGIPVIGCQCSTCKSANASDKRLRSSILVKLDDKTIIIDAGPDFRGQILRANITELDAILITHGHKDHIGGLDDIRAFNFLSKKSMPIYAGEFTFPNLKRELHYVFDRDRFPGIPKIDLIAIDDHPFTIGSTSITPIKVHHINNPVLGFRIKDFTYITDASKIEGPELEKIRGSKVIVLNALRKEEHKSHFSLDEAVDLLKHLAPEKAFLTHISHLMGLSEEVSKELPDFIELAYDGQTIHLD